MPGLIQKPTVNLLGLKLILGCGMVTDWLVPSKTKDPLPDLFSVGLLTKDALLFLPERSLQPPPASTVAPLVPITNSLGIGELFCSIIGAAQYVLIT